MKSIADEILSRKETAKLREKLTVVEKVKDTRKNHRTTKKRADKPCEVCGWGLLNDKGKCEKCAKRLYIIGVACNVCGEKLRYRANGECVTCFREKRRRYVARKRAAKKGKHNG